MAQLALQYGADDFGGTLIGEEVVSCTGARSTELTDKKIIDAIHQIGYQVEERDNFYNPVNCTIIHNLTILNLLDSLFHHQLLLALLNFSSIPLFFCFLSCINSHL